MAATRIWGGGLLSADPDQGGACPCGALTKDTDAGRLGSRLGDAAIAVYRPRRPA